MSRYVQVCPHGQGFLVQLVLIVLDMDYFKHILHH